MEADVGEEGHHSTSRLEPAASSSSSQQHEQPPTASASSQRARQRQRRRCELCGSRRFHRDGSTGLIVCDEGHVLQGYREEVGDEGDEAFKVVSQKRKKDRTGEENRRQRQRRERLRRESKFWRGPRGRFLHYQCLQLLLRLQIQAIKEEIPDLPDQLETVARELWALWVSRVPNLEPRPLVEQLGHAADKLRKQQWDDDAVAGKIKAAAAAINVSQREQEDRERQMLREQEDEQRERLDQALREAGVAIDEENGQGQGGDSSAGEAFSHPLSQDSGTESAFEDEDGEVIFPMKRTGRKFRPTILGVSSYLDRSQRGNEQDGVTTVTAILYLSLLMLRIPLLLKDITRLIASGKVPYMHASHCLPSEMISHLPYANIRMLDAKRVPSVLKLQNKTAFVATQLNSAFGVTFPSFNALPVLLTCSQRMLLPPTFFLAAKTLLGYTELPMQAVPPECSQGASNSQAWWIDAIESEESEEDGDDTDEVAQGVEKADLATAEANTTIKAKRQRPGGRLIVSVHGKGQPRCAVLMALLLVVVKMHYGLDGCERMEKSSDAPSGAPKLVDWLDALSLFRERLRTDARLVSDPNAMDLFEMDEGHMDAYLDYLESNQILLNNYGVYEGRRREGHISDMLSCAPDAPPFKQRWSASSSSNAQPDGETQENVSGPQITGQSLAMSPLEAIRQHSTHCLEHLYGKVESKKPQQARGSHRRRSESTLPDSAANPIPGQDYPIYQLGDNFDASNFSGSLRQVVEAGCDVVGSGMEDMIATMSAIEKVLVKTLRKGQETRLASRPQHADV